MKGMRMTMAALAAMGALVLAGTASAQTADEVIKKNIDAIGGKAKLEAVKSLSRTGELAVNGQFGEMEGTTELKLIPGKKAYQMVDLGVFYRVSGWEGGDTGWQDDAMEGLRDISGNELQMLRAQATLNPLSALKDAGFEVKKLDEDKGELLPEAPAAPAAGAAPADAAAAAAAPAEPKTFDAIVLEAGPADGPKTKFYIDKATNLLKQIRIKQENAQMGEVEVVVQHEEYAEFDGIKLPSKTRMAMGEAFEMNTTWTETVINGEMDEKVFSKPEPPAAPAAAPASDAPGEAKPEERFKEGN